MSLFKRLFRKKTKSTLSNKEFWEWFQQNERIFADAVRNQEKIHEQFLNKLSEKLNSLRDGYYYLTGVNEDENIELIITAEGNLKNIAFAEELVAIAPNIAGWEFLAHKPALDIENVNISMNGERFDKDNLSFYANIHSEYPDLIDLTLVHQDYREDNQSTIVNGTYIFLDNYLGELNSLTQIDQLNVVGPSDKQETIPIHKLKDFLKWREKEFLEKYEGVRFHTEEDNHVCLEGQKENGLPIIAIVNASLLSWDQKASHPWIAIVQIEYDGESYNGMPSEEDFATLEEIEAELMNDLVDSEGYLNVGRETGDNARIIYFACKDFRLPSKKFFEMSSHASKGLKISYDIFKDKYWQTLEKFS